MWMVIGTWAMAIVTLISVLVALYEVHDGRERYIDSIQPIISFKLTCSDEHLDLEVLNTGRSPVYNLRIVILKIFGVEGDYDKNSDNFHGAIFDLYPDEEVCNHIARITKKASRAIVQLSEHFDDDWEKNRVVYRTVFLYGREFDSLVVKELAMDNYEQ